MREVCRQKKKGKRYIHQRWKTRGICKCREWYIMRLAHVVSNEDVKSVVGKIMCNAKSKMRDRLGNKTEGGEMCARPVTIYPKKGLWGYERKMKNVRKKEKKRKTQNCQTWRKSAPKPIRRNQVCIRFLAQSFARILFLVVILYFELRI